MQKWLIVGAVVVVLAAVVAFAAANLNSYLNRNKAWLAEQAEDVLNRRVSFEEIGVSVVGGLGVKITNLRIADDPGFSGEDFVRAERVQVAVKILPALFGRYEVAHLMLEKPVVAVVRTAQGFNFDTIGKAAPGTAQEDLQEDSNAGRAQPAAEAPEPAAPRSAQALPLLISTLRVRGGEISFVDRTAEQSGEEAGRLSVRRFDFSASNVGFSAPVQVEVAAALLGSEDQNFGLQGTVGPIGEVVNPDQVPFQAQVEIDPLDVDELGRALPAAAAAIPPGLGLSGPLRLTARLSGSPAEVSVSDLELAAAVFDAEEPNLVVKGEAGPVGGGGLDPDLGIDVEIDLGPVAIDDLKQLEALADTLPPTLSAPDPVRVHAVAKGTLGRLGLGVSFDGTEAAISVGSDFVKPKGVPLRLDFEGERSAESVDIKNLKIQLAALALSGSGKILVAEPLSLDVRIDIGQAPLDGWDRLVPMLAAYDVSGTVAAQLHANGALPEGGIPRVTGTIDFRDVDVRVEDRPQALEDFSSRVELTGDTAVLPPTKFRVSGSPVELRATVKGFQAPVVTFRLHSAELRAASLGVESESGGGDEIIRGLEVDGTLSTAEATPSFRGTIRSSGGLMRGIDYQDLEGELRLAQEVATLDEVKLRALGGSATGSGNYDMRDAGSPKFDMRCAVDGMGLKGLLADRFPDAATKIEGNLHANLSLAGAGQDWETISQKLRGSGRAELKDGALKDVNIGDSVLRGVTGVPGLSALIPTRVRDKHPDLFNAGDTAFDSLGGSARIADGRVVTDDLALTSHDYTIRGQGSFTFESRVDFTATLAASQELTTDVIADVPIARHLTGPEGRLQVPFRLTGVLPRVRPKPDVDFVARVLRGALIEEGIGTLLGDKAKVKEKAKRGGQKKKARVRDQNRGQGRPRQKGQAPPPVEDLLQKGLEGIFGQ